MAVPPVLIHLVFGVSIPNHAITGVPPLYGHPPICIICSSAGCCISILEATTPATTE